MFTVTINLADVSTYETKKDAVKDFINRIKAELENCMTYQALETMCWIKDDNSMLPDMFYDVRDEAIENEWINEKGEWIAE
jgi:uncharacterized membrane-anchored protein